jgi:hypothetical protein
MATPECPERDPPQIPPPPVQCASAGCTRQALSKGRFCSDCYDHVLALWPHIETERQP